MKVNVQIIVYTVVYMSCKRPMILFYSILFYSDYYQSEHTNMKITNYKYDISR